MNRIAEASLIGGAAILAALGVAISNLSNGGSVDAQVVLTFFTFIIAWGGLWFTVQRLIPRANPYLLPISSLLSAIGLVEIYRLNPSLGSLQRWWMLAAAALGSLTIYWLRGGTAALRRYRYLFLLGGVLLLLAPLLPSSWPIGGVSVNGSRLWLRLNMFGGTLAQFQPGELAKLALIVFFGSYLAERRQALTERPSPLRSSRIAGATAVDADCRSLAGERHRDGLSTRPRCFTAVVRRLHRDALHGDRTNRVSARRLWLVRDRRGRGVSKRSLTSNVDTRHGPLPLMTSRAPATRSSRACSPWDRVRSRALVSVLADLI